MSIILTPFAKLLLLFYDLTGSYGVSLILFGLVIRLILFPIFLKGRKGMLSMSGLAEKQKVLQQKYARDRVKYSQELQRLYEEEGVKPSSGCLWSFLPLPFLMVLYAIVRQPLTYLLNMTQDQFNVVSNLLYGNVLDYRNQQLQMAQDVFLNHDKIVAAVPELANMPQIDFTFLGVNLSQTPHFMFWKADDIGAAFGLWLIPVISAALGVVSMIVTNHINGKVLGTRRTMDQSTRMTMFIMPLFSLWICFTPARRPGCVLDCQQPVCHAAGSAEHPLPPLLPEKAGRGQGQASGRGERARQTRKAGPGGGQEKGRRGDAPDSDGAQAEQEHRHRQPGGYPGLRPGPAV